MPATATEPRTSGRHGPGPSRGLRALGEHSANGANGTARVSPHDVDAERALIGAMLVPAAGWSAIEAAMATLVPDDFYVQPHPNVVAAIFSLAAKGTPVDLVTVADELRKQSLWVDELGAQLVTMMGEAPSIGGAAGWASIVAGCSRRRRFRSVAFELDHAAQEGDEEALARALAEAHDVAAAGRPELVVEDLGAVIRGEEPEIVPTLLYRSDGQALLYPGLLHWVMGEPGCGKTWLALVACHAAAQSGLTSLYLDYEGSRRIVGGRLARLRATEDEVVHIAYVRPSGGSQTTGPGAVCVVRELGVGLVVIDGAAKAMAREGLDEDRASEVLGWLERMVWPLCAAGAAVVVLDHVPKDKDARGRWARGSGAKLGEVDGAAYNVEVRETWSRAKAGKAAVKVAKDREGMVGAVGDVAAMLRFVPDAGDLRAWLDAPDGTAVPNTATSAVEAVLNELGGMEVSQVRLEELVREKGSWRSTAVRSAAESLATTGRIRMRIGPRNAHLYSSNAAPVQEELEPMEEDF